MPRYLTLALGIALAAGCAGPDGATIPLRYAWGPARPTAPCEEWAPLHGAPRGRDGAGTLWLCGRVPRILARARDPVVLVPPAPFELIAEVGSERRFARTRGDDGATPGLAWSWVPLRPEDEGALLVMEVRSSYPFRIGPTGPLRVGERAELVRQAMQKDALGITCGLTLLVIGLIGLVAFRPKGEVRVGVGVSAAALASGVYSLHYTILRDWVVPSPMGWTLGWAMAVAVLPAAVGTVTAHAFDLPDRHLLRRLARFHVAFVPVYALRGVIWGPLAGAVPATIDPAVQHAMAALDIVLRVAMLLGIVVLVVEATKRVRRHGAYVLAGLSVLVASSAYDIARFLGGPDAAWHSLVPLGYLGMVLGLVALVRARYAEAREKVTRYADALARRDEERGRMVRDLHDGIGGLLSNLRLLAEVARRGGASADRAVVQIGELSEEAMRELRSFIASARDGVGSWEALAAELRRIALQLAEAREREVEVEAELGPDAPPPSAELALHARKVVQEAMTNALKHSSRGAIHLRIEVGAGGFGLSVRDEGGEAADADGGGVGLASLKARARALGGALDVRLDATGSSVELRVPLSSA